MENRAALGSKDIHILIVDDEYINQFIAGKILREYGFDHTFASSGLEALQMINTQTFHLVLMDMDLPEMDGREITRCIRSMKDAYFKKVPILMYSSSSVLLSLEEVIRMGMTDIAQKPLNITDLQHKIAKHVVHQNL